MRGVGVHRDSYRENRTIMGVMMMQDDNVNRNLWKYILPVLSVVLWVMTIVAFFKSNGTYTTNDYEAEMAIINAQRWYPACLIGAVITTAVSYFISQLCEYIDREKM